MASSSSVPGSRVPQGEVIMDFADGGQYIKHQLENSVVALERRRLTRDEAAKASRAMEALEVKAPAPVNAADADLIVKELGVSREEAENALRSEKDVTKALVKLTAPRR
ncbi:uncharacterized protein EHS24_007857 [Apiotrichum porosum]|uniref:Nascent polypeptide-associated complex subunit alpha-like UBA domain-containing protein n=1 Tax=Apiotrichum porosum TaxID=105984 RepID=A0A427XS56_9TREE|nr:uncharacterized protein EHS24_007857 [Apiotrichum porosum]RSH81674.1 hypothetical protein EHS24_007857 [Apiotrichum porosum]